MTVTHRRHAMPAQGKDAGVIVDPARTASAATDQLRRLRGLAELPPMKRRSVKRAPPPARASHLSAWTDSVTAAEVWQQALARGLTASQLVALAIEAVAREDRWTELVGRETWEEGLARGKKG